MDYKYYNEDLEIEIGNNRYAYVNIEFRGIRECTFYQSLHLTADPYYSEPEEIEYEYSIEDFGYDIDKVLDCNENKVEPTEDELKFIDKYCKDCASRWVEEERNWN